MIRFRKIYLKRLHFHQFMQNLHKRSHQLKMQQQQQQQQQHH